MNVNGARFHLLLGATDWAGCKPASPSADVPVFDKDKGRLTLRPLVEPIPVTPGEPLFTATDHRDAVADRNGNLYVIADDRLGLRVCSAGDGRVTPFWPLAGQASAALAKPFTDADPTPPAAEPLAGLTITGGDFLVAGVPGGLLRFDLIGGGPPERLTLPEGIVPTALAATSDGGLWLLDAAAARLLQLDGDLNIRIELVEGELEIFAPAGEKPEPGLTAQPVAIDTSAAPSPVAIATLDDGSVLLLDAPANDPAGLFIVDPGATVVRPLIRLDFVATCFALEQGAAGTAVLLAETSGNQARRIALNNEGGSWQALPEADTLPLRRFGGRALVNLLGRIHYDSGPGPLWVPVIEIPHCRYAREAALVTRVYDSGEPQCVWDRLVLDGWLPGGTSVLVEARAADDPATLATQPDAGWVRQPAPVLSPTGGELPGKRAIAAIATDPRTGKGSWQLLLQNITGRYAQLRITLAGDGRVTPVIRAVRLWYPRFSYAERFLPGVYREEPASASFLERFLANFEGVNTRIEDGIATAETLFDPRIVPADMLPWLASWFEVALDPVWDERRRRLFVAHAAGFFGWRGTTRGLQLALKLALDATISAEDFDLERADCSCPGTIRIVESWRSRIRGRSFPAAQTIPGPGARSLEADWLPEEGAAGLWARWPETPAPTGRFPLFPPTGEEAAWTSLVQAQFGFVPSTGQGERARWQAFQAAIGVASPATDLPSAASDAWFRFAALPGADRQAWQDFLRARYRTIDLLNAAHGSGWDNYSLVSLPDHLPATPAAARDWLMFEGHEMPIGRAAHRFSVLLPRDRVDTDPDAEATQLALARRIIALEKPAHTVFDVRFYWAMNRVGEARLGLDSAIGQGSRAPELIPGAVLGRTYVGAAFVGGPADPPQGRSRIAC